MGGIAKHMEDLIPQAKPSGGMGAVGAAVVAAAKEAQLAKLQQEVTRLTKLVHILWKEAERLEKHVQVTPDGLRIKSGMSEVLVLTNGGIILNGHRIHLKTPGKDELMY
jgi:hypothetical protein